MTFLIATFLWILTVIVGGTLLAAKIGIAYRTPKRTFMTEHTPVRPPATSLRRLSVPREELARQSHPKPTTQSCRMREIREMRKEVSKIILILNPQSSILNNNQEEEQQQQHCAVVS
jgi:hypothetical protein